MIRFFLRHPVATWMLFTAFVVTGIYAFPKLQIEAIPEVDLPTLTIQTRWNGASPEAIHRSITLPIEEAVGRVHGVEKVTSSSRPGMSQVEVEFRRDVNIDFARVDLNEQMGAVRRQIPLNASQPNILPYVPEEFQTGDFFTFSLESSLEPNELREQAESWIVPRVLAVDGVADARVQGGGRPLVEIILDRQALDLYGLSADAVFQRLNTLDMLTAAGTIIDAGEEKLLALRQPVDRMVLENTVVARNGDAVVRLGRVGSVRTGYEDAEYFVRANGKTVVQIAVEKRSGANTVTVSRNVTNALPELEASVPFDARFHIDEDQGEELRDKLEELVYRSLIILAILFLLLAISLREIRLTTIVIASILFAIVISMSLFYFFDISVNFVTISGLTVCFGLLLDNSILVLDSIHRRLELMKKNDDSKLSRSARGKLALETIIAGTGDVLFPILATTLTTMVAFVSFIFLSGRLALFYVPLAVSVATAMAASLFVAFGWIPVALHQGWARPLVNKSHDGPMDDADSDAVRRLVEDLPDLETKPRFFERIFYWTQRLWWLVLPPAAAVILWSYVEIYDNKVLKGGFWRLPDREELFLYLEMPSGTDILVTSETMQKFEESLLPIPEGARLTSTTFGNRAVMTVEFEDDMLSTHYPLMFRANLVEVADATGGSSIFIRGFSEQPYFKGPFGGSSLNSTIKLTGYNSKRLGELAENVVEKVQTNRRARKARITSGARFERAFQDETVLYIDRKKLAEFDLSVVEVVGTVRRLLGVDTPWNMMIEGENQRVKMSFEDAETIEYSDVAAKTIPNSKGEQVKLADLVYLEMEPVKGTISREDQRYTMFVSWEYIGTDKMRKAYIERIMDTADLPYGYNVEETKQEFFTQEEEEELTLTIILAIVFIYIVLAALFESLSLPMLVLSSLPMALCGVFIAFWITDSTFDSSARIGLILLFGIVVNNAILLVSRFRTEAGLILKAKLGGDPEAEAGLFSDQSKRLGGSDLWVLPKEERASMLRRAVARGVIVRLRSILLTSGTTIVGLLPLLIKFNDQAGRDIWENLALSSIGGLVSSTILLLLAMPPLYYAIIRGKWLMMRMGLALVRLLKRLFGKGPKLAPKPAEG